MNEAKFTKGSWSLTDHRKQSRKGDIEVFAGRHLVSDLCAWGSDDEAQEIAANAHLIAAAPEMYEEIKAFHKLVVEASETGFDINNGDWADKLFSSQGNRYRLLAKARGEK